MAEEDRCASVALQALNALQFASYSTTYTVAHANSTTTLSLCSAETGTPQATVEESDRKDDNVASPPSQKPRSSRAKPKNGGEPRGRSYFNETQLMYMERSFEASPYACLKTRERLRRETGISEEKIQGWFKNRRARLRKTAREMNSSNPAIDYSAPRQTYCSGQLYPFVHMDAQSSDIIALRQLNNLQFSLYCMTHSESSAKMVSMPPPSKVFPKTEFSQFAFDQIAKEAVGNLNIAQHEVEKHGFYVNPPQEKMRGRRERSHFTGSQLSCLEEAFNASQYADISTRYKLQLETGIPETKIQVWFKNRRARLRKSERESKLSMVEIQLKMRA